MNLQGDEARVTELREFAEVLRGRRTIELFLQLPVPDSLVKEAIDTAIWAPNHKLTEPWRFYLLGKERIARCIDLVREITSDKKGAAAGDFKAKRWAEKPGWLVLTCQRSDDELQQLEDYGACCAAAQNLLLYLWKAGIGSKWTSGAITRDERFFDILGADAKQEFVVGLIWYGFAKIIPTQNRKPLPNVLKQL